MFGNVFELTRKYRSRNVNIRLIEYFGRFTNRILSICFFVSVSSSSLVVSSSAVSGLPVGLVPSFLFVSFF